MTNRVNAAESIVRENGGLLVASVFFKDNSTRWTIWLVKGKLSNLNHVNVFRNGEMFNTFSTEADIENAPKRLRDLISRTLRDADQLLSTHNQIPVSA